MLANGFPGLLIPYPQPEEPIDNNERATVWVNDVLFDQPLGRSLDV